MRLVSYRELGIRNNCLEILPLIEKTCVGSKACCLDRSFMIYFLSNLDMVLNSFDCEYEFGLDFLMWNNTYDFTITIHYHKVNEHIKIRLVHESFSDWTLYHLNHKVFINNSSDKDIIWIEFENYFRSLLDGLK